MNRLRQIFKENSDQSLPPEIIDPYMFQWEINNVIKWLTPKLQETPYTDNNPHEPSAHYNDLVRKEAILKLITELNQYP